MLKQIYILSLNGFWDPKTNAAVGITFASDADPEHAPVTFDTIGKYRLKKQTGKRNSVTRPFVYVGADYIPNIAARDKFYAKHAKMTDELNSLITSNAVFTQPNEQLDGLFCPLVVPKNIRPAIGKILKKYGFENVYTQVKGTKYYSSYTPEDLENAFVKLA